MKAISQLAAIVGISLAAAGGTFLMKGPPVRSFNCDPADLKAGEICLQQIPAETRILWVDARLRKDWLANGLAGSVLWNLDRNEDIQAMEAEAAARIMENPRVVVYCGDENCGLSHQVADQIRALQLGAEVSVLRGGWRALKEAGRIKDSNQTP